MDSAGRSPLDPNTSPVKGVSLRSADGATEAVFIPEANMVCGSLRHCGVEFLHAGDGVAAYADRGRTMGIPLLHPWANRIDGYGYHVGGRDVVLPRDPAWIADDGRGLPIHGVIPGRLRWKLTRSDPQALTALLRWRSPELLQLFPFEHELRVEAAVASGRLQIVTTLRATGDVPVPVSFGYHPYLCLPTARRELWEVTLGASRRLVLDGRMIPTGERKPVLRPTLRLGDETFDDAFDARDAPARFRAAGGGLAVTTEFLEGFPYAQVYTPRAAEFICFEPMTAPANALNSGEDLPIVAPGEEYRAAFAISITPDQEPAPTT